MYNKFKYTSRFEGSNLFTESNEEGEFGEQSEKIALITSNPESLYQQRVMEGVFEQCNKYNYDVVVLSTLVYINHFYKDYLEGELGIYDMIHFDAFDGIIITPITLSDNERTNVCANLLKYDAEALPL